MIHSLIESIATRKSRSFWVAFFFLIATAMLMRPSSSCLKTAITPLAIIDLELAFDQQTAERIKKLWAESDCQGKMALATNRIDAAFINIYFDFPFIAAYCYFFIVLIVLCRFKEGANGVSVTLTACYMAISIGMLDIVENMFMLIFLKWESIPSYLFAISASAKFALILLLVAFILIRLGRKTITLLRTRSFLF